jgi:hypothetical protein
MTATTHVCSYKNYSCSRYCDEFYLNMIRCTVLCYMLCCTAYFASPASSSCILSHSSCLGPTAPPNRTNRWLRPSRPAGLFWFLLGLILSRMLRAYKLLGSSPLLRCRSTAVRAACVYGCACTVGRSSSSSGSSSVSSASVCGGCSTVRVQKLRAAMKLNYTG